MALSEKDVDYIAGLARIHLSDENKKNFTVQLESILTYINKLNELDTQHVEPTAHILPIQNVFRSDISMQSDMTSAAVAQAPQLSGHLFQVPPVIE